MDRQLLQKIYALSSCGKIDRARMTRWLSSLSSRCLPSPLSQKPKTIAALFGTDAVTMDIDLLVIIFLQPIILRSIRVRPDIEQKHQLEVAARAINYTAPRGTTSRQTAGFDQTSLSVSREI